jgi:iron complex outermembrane receptor protein
MGNEVSRRKSGLTAKLMSGTALAAAGLVLTGAARAAETGTPSEVEQVVVTGTSIHGVAPVGANVITIDQAQIRRTGVQTVQQLLADVPQVTGFNNYGQGSFGSADPSGTHAPTLHSLGASASNGTLILVDGHRLPLGGFNHTLADPNIIPPAALERVEVLPDGASAIYGSDAVAGVLNFITRRRFDGTDASVQAGFGDHYRTSAANLAVGKTWDRGSALLVYGYSHRSALKNGDRDFYKTDLRALGGSNFNSFACAPATIQPGASGGATFLLAPYTGAPVSASSASCAYTYDIDTFPAENRHNLLGRVEQKLSDRLTLTADVVYSNRKDRQDIAVGSVSNVVVFGPGSAPAGGPGQVNPFFVGPAGTTVERVSFSADELFPNAKNRAGAETVYGALKATYDLGQDWVADLSGLWGQDESFTRNYGVLCASCVILGLNGTTNVTGNTTTPSIPGRSTVVLNLPLTAANAVDVWNPLAGNRMSAATRSGLLDDNSSFARQKIGNAKLVAGGPAFALPGGPVRVSVGGEWLLYSLDQSMLATANAGPIAQNAIDTRLGYTRDVYALFGETVVPIVGKANAMPGVRRLDLSGAVRYDHYDDFGGTTNPRVAAMWEPAEGLQFRGSYGTSFTAPALTSRGDDVFGVSTDSNYGASGQQILPGSFPGANTLPGCAAVTAATSCAIGGSNPAQGLQVNGANNKLKPQTGDTWSVGLDWRPTGIRGFRLGLTYWAAKYRGLIAAPSFSQVVSSPGLNGALTLNPTAAQVAAATAGLRQATALPATVNFIYSFQQRNVSTLDASGIDLDARYSFASGFGDWTLGAAVSDKLKFAQQYGSGTPYLSRLNTAGINATFSSIRLLARGSVGWSLDGWAANLYVNHTGAYWNRTSTAMAVSGPRGQRVASYTTIDAHLAYDIPADGWLKDAQVFVDAQNLFDQDPPFVNTPGGYNILDSNPIGRVVSVGARKRW